MFDLQTLVTIKEYYFVSVTTVDKKTEIVVNINYKITAVKMVYNLSM